MPPWYVAEARFGRSDGSPATPSARPARRSPGHSSAGAGGTTATGLCACSRTAWVTEPIIRAGANSFMAVAAHHDQCGVPGLADQVTGRVPGHHDGLGGDLRVPLPAGGEQALGEGTRLVLHGLLVDLRGRDLSGQQHRLQRPRVGGDDPQAGATQGGLREGVVQRRRVGAVGARPDDHGAVPAHRRLLPLLPAASRPGHHDHRTPGVPGGGQGVRAEQQAGEASAAPRAQHQQPGLRAGLGQQRAGHALGDDVLDGRRAAQFVHPRACLREHRVLVGAGRPGVL